MYLCKMAFSALYNKQFLLHNVLHRNYILIKLCKICNLICKFNNNNFSFSVELLLQNILIFLHLSHSLFLIEGHLQKHLNQ